MHLLEKLWTPKVLLLKKIDSTLRGQPAAEIALTIDFLKRKTGYAFGVMAPAFPAMGGITCGGKIFVDGIELECTELCQREHTYPISDRARLSRVAPVCLAH